MKKFRIKMSKKGFFSILWILGVMLVINYSIYAQENFSSLQFDGVAEYVAYPPSTTYFRCYWKGVKLRLEEIFGSTTFVFLYDGQNAYNYFPDKRVAWPVTFNHPFDMLPFDCNYKGKPGLKHISQESLEGRICDIYEYPEGIIKHKIWVAQDLDFPIKVVKEELNTAELIETTYLKNIRKNITLDESLFQLPAGTKIEVRGDYSKYGNQR